MTRADTTPTSPGAVDWGLGEYEHTAAQLLPAARVVVDRAAPAQGEHVVDVGCGTGNAALLVAARGIRVTGVDPARRLIDVARQHAAVQGLDATFAIGTAGALPLADGDADVILSVFGVIFAPDPAAAAAEMARVTAPGGRIVLSAWIPGNPISETSRIAGEAIRRALGMPGAPPFAWHERDALAGVLGPHGFEVELDEHRQAFTGESPRAYFEAHFEAHPLWVAGRAILEPRGEATAVRDRALEILVEGNEDPDGFRVTSRYVVATARRR
jgi:SAM-dependent methyltransferase